MKSIPPTAVAARHGSSMRLHSTKRFIHEYHICGAFRANPPLTVSQAGIVDFARRVELQESREAGGHKPRIAAYIQK